MSSGQTVQFYYLLKGYRLRAGEHVLRVKGKAGVRWKFYPDMRPNVPPAPPHQHREGDPVQGEMFDVQLTFKVRDGTSTELKEAFAPYVVAAQGWDFERRRRAREAITETAPEFLEKTILGFASDAGTADLTVHGLQQMNTPASRADLVKLFDESIGPRIAIVQALAEVATPQELPFFASLLPGRSTKEDDQVRQWAALGLGHIGGDAAARALRDAPASPNGRVRSAVVLALGNTGSPLAVPALIRMYGDHDVQNETCGALRGITHYEWCDGSGDVGRLQTRWNRWWSTNRSRLKLYRDTECPNWNATLPEVK